MWSCGVICRPRQEKIFPSTFQSGTGQGISTSFSLAEDNWLSRYLLARWFKNKYDKHKSKGAFSDFHPIKAFKQLTGGWSDSKSSEGASPVDQSKSNGDLDVAGDGGATISPKAKVSVQSLIIL
jgi:hypothetical protein